MTVIEAAAFGAPSLLQSGDAVGAAELLQPDGSFQLPLHQTEMIRLAHDVSAILRDQEALGKVAVIAKERALSWSEEAYGQQLHCHLKAWE